MAELTAPLVFKNEEKRIVYGPVLVPDEPDTDNDVVTAEKIEEVAHKFVEEYGNIDLMHTLNNVGRLVESYILPVDLQVNEDTVIPKGSWMMGVRVTDDDTWKAVKDGRLGGFSIMALQKAAIKSSEKNHKVKRVTLADLGDDWIVNAVSLVDEPAVPKAKWIAIKNKNNININDDIVKKAVAGSLEHRKQLLEEEIRKTFTDNSYPYIYATMEDSVVFQVYDEDDTPKWYQVNYTISEDGEVTFTSEPKEVLIEENIVEVEETDQIEEVTEEENQISTNSKNSKSLMSKFMKKFGFKSNQVQTEKGEEEMTKDDVQKMIDESLEPINSKLDDVIKVMKEGVNPEEGETEESATKSKEENQEENYKEKYESVLKELQRRPFSHRLSGQDGVEKSKDDDKPKNDRNAFGYKVK